MKLHAIFPKDQKNKKLGKGQETILASKHRLRPTDIGDIEGRKASGAETIIRPLPDSN